MNEIKGDRVSRVIVDEVPTPTTPVTPFAVISVEGLRDEFVVTCMRDMAALRGALAFEIFAPLCRHAVRIFSEGRGPIHFRPKAMDTLIIEVEGLRQTYEFASGEEVAKRGVWAARPHIPEVERVLREVRSYAGPVRLVPSLGRLPFEPAAAERIKKHMEATKGKVFTPIVVETKPMPSDNVPVPFVPWTEEEMRGALLDPIYEQIHTLGRCLRSSPVATPVYRGCLENELSNWQRLLAYAKEKLP